MQRITTHATNCGRQSSNLPISHLKGNCRPRAGCPGTRLMLREENGFQFLR